MFFKMFLGIVFFFFHKVGRACPKQDKNIPNNNNPDSKPNYSSHKHYFYFSHQQLSSTNHVFALPVTQRDINVPGMCARAPGTLWGRLDLTSTMSTLGETPAPKLQVWGRVFHININTTPTEIWTSKTTNTQQPLQKSTTQTQTKQIVTQTFL
jgi:hypothetical protein